MNKRWEGVGILKILAIGDNVADCYVDKGVYYPGGNAANVAVGCKRNGAETSAYIGIFGNDREAEHIRYALGCEGIEMERCRRADLPSGHPQVGHTADGDRFFITSPKNTCQHMVRIGLIEEDYEYIKRFNHIHTSVFSYMDYELPKLRECCSVSYDFSNHIDKDRISSVCPNVDMAFFSASHLNERQRMDLIHTAHSLGTAVAGLTLGSEGALFSVEGALYVQKAENAEIIDTMGAGDSFIASFLIHYKGGASMAEALKKAAGYAAKSCGESGAFGYEKPLEEVFLKSIGRL